MQREATVQIGEAGTGHSFTSQAEGCIPLRMRGKQLPLFTKTIYAEQVNENIMSVPEAVEKGYSVVFTRAGVRFYDKQLEVKDEPIIIGARDPRNRLFYVNFATPPKREAVASISSVEYICKQRELLRLPFPIEDQEPPAQVSVNLSKTYHEFKSEIEMWHPRMAHINTKLITRALPTLKHALFNAMTAREARCTSSLIQGSALKRRTYHGERASTTPVTSSGLSSEAQVVPSMPPSTSTSEADSCTSKQ